MADPSSPVPTYPPLDALKDVAENVWIVDSGPLRFFGLVLPVRMTVVRLGNGDLWLHSPTRYDESLARVLERHGRVRHLVASNVAHWMHVRDWQQRYPDATTWAAPGLRERGQVKKSGVRLDRDLAEAAPPEWAGEIDQTIFPGGAGFREVDFFHKASRTLILTDLIVNLEPDKLPLIMRTFARVTGVTAPNGKAPLYLRWVIRARPEGAKEAAARLLAWAPERVVFAHGRWFERDGAAALRRSLSWLI